MILTVQIAIDVSCFLKEPVRFAGTALSAMMQAHIVASVGVLGVIFPVHRLMRVKLSQQARQFVVV
jgi:hypothetical protein